MKTTSHWNRNCAKVKSSKFWLRDQFITRNIKFQQHMPMSFEPSVVQFHDPITNAIELKKSGRAIHNSAVTKKKTNLPCGTNSITNLKRQKKAFAQPEIFIIITHYDTNRFSPTPTTLSSKIFLNPRAVLNVVPRCWHNLNYRSEWVAKFVPHDYDENLMTYSPC